MLQRQRQKHTPSYSVQPLNINTNSSIHSAKQVNEQLGENLFAGLINKYQECHFIVCWYVGYPKIVMPEEMEEASRLLIANHASSIEVLLVINPMAEPAHLDALSVKYKKYFEELKKQNIPLFILEENASFSDIPVWVNSEGKKPNWHDAQERYDAYYEENLQELSLLMKKDIAKQYSVLYETNVAMSDRIKDVLKDLIRKKAIFFVANMHSLQNEEINACFKKVVLNQEGKKDKNVVIIESSSNSHGSLGLIDHVIPAERAKKAFARLSNTIVYACISGLAVRDRLKQKNVTEKQISEGVRQFSSTTAFINLELGGEEDHGDKRKTQTWPMLKSQAREFIRDRFINALQDVCEQYHGREEAETVKAILQDKNASQQDIDRVVYYRGAKARLLCAFIAHPEMPQVGVPEEVRRKTI